jgi:hypothetical protein
MTRLGLSILTTLAFLVALATAASAQTAAPTQTAAPAQAAAPAQRAQGSSTQAQAMPQDLSAPAPDLPKGVIEAVIVDGKEQPIVGTDVRLGIMYQSVAEGESRSEKFARTDGSGRVRFEGLSIGNGYSYRVTLKSGAAEYSTTPLNLPEDSGYRVRLHVYPVTHDVSQTYIGLRGIIFIETRDDIFQFQVMMRVLNLGAVTWVPRDVSVSLPRGFKAFGAEKGMTDTRFEVDEGRGAKLLGTFTPGQHEVSFRFQVPKVRDPSASFELGLLPHVYEMRVIAAASPTMKLDVSGFEEPRVDQTQNGQRVLVTRRLFNAKEQVSSFSVHLSGLPVPGPGRWIAAVIAALLAASGFGAARGYLNFDAPGKLKPDEELVVARELILKELVLVERARQAGDLGPRAHTDARRALIDALARLGPRALGSTKAKRRGAIKRAVDPAERPAPPSTA